MARLNIDCLFTNLPLKKTCEEIDEQIVKQFTVTKDDKCDLSIKTENVLFVTAKYTVSHLGKCYPFPLRKRMYLCLAKAYKTFSSKDLSECL